MISTPREKGGNKWYSCRGVWRQRGGGIKWHPPHPPVISTPREKGNQVAHPPCDAATATGEPAEPLLPSPRWARCLRLLALGNQVVHLPGEGGYNDGRIR